MLSAGVINGDGRLVAASMDEGKSWHLVMYHGSGVEEWTIVPEYKTFAVNPFSDPASYPVISCNPIMPTQCYRITGLPLIEESSDSGKTWFVTWQHNADRDEYRQRINRSAFSNRTPDTIPQAIAIVPGTNGITVLVAMGNEGLLVNEQGKGWQPVVFSITDPNYHYQSEQPTPYQALTLSDAVTATQVEMSFLLPVALLYWSIFCLWYRQMALRKTPDRTAKQDKEPSLAATISLILSVLLLLIMVFAGETASDDLVFATYFSLGLIWIIFLVPIIVHHSTAPKSIPQPIRANEGLIIPWVVLVFAICWMPFILWAFGIIERYFLALGISIVVGLVLVSVAYRFASHKLSNFPDMEMNES